MELGPIQLKWVEALEANPEEQVQFCLGKTKEDGTFGYCCLGKGLEVLGKGIIKLGVLTDTGTDTSGRPDKNDNTLEFSFEQLGLRSPNGITLESFTLDGKSYYDGLAEANDGGMTWLEIAAEMRKNPDNIFIRSV